MLQVSSLIFLCTDFKLVSKVYLLFLFEVRQFSVVECALLLCKPFPFSFLNEKIFCLSNTDPYLVLSLHMAIVWRKIGLFRNTGHRKCQACCVIHLFYSLHIVLKLRVHMAGQENLNISRSDSCSHIFLFLFNSHISKPKIPPYNFVRFSEYQNLADLPKTIFKPHMYDILLPLNYQCHLNQ